MIRAGGVVGAKKAPDFSELTQEEREKFIYAAVHANVLDTQQSGHDIHVAVDVLIREYRTWYIANERR